MLPPKFWLGSSRSQVHDSGRWWFPYPSEVPGYLPSNMEKLTGILKHQSSIIYPPWKLTATAPEDGCIHSMLSLNLLILLEVHHCSGVEAAKSFELLPWKPETSDSFHARGCNTEKSTIQNHPWSIFLKDLWCWRMDIQSQQRLSSHVFVHDSCICCSCTTKN